VTDPGFERWQPGFGAIRHRRETRDRVRALLASLGRDDAWPLFHAADRLASAGAWLVVHQTYARTVHLDGRTLTADDFEHRGVAHAPH
jgi:hypothetical protein